MSNLVKYQNINMSDSPVIIGNDGDNSQSTDCVIPQEDCLGNDNPSTETGESNETLSADETSKINDVEKTARINAKKIEENAKRKAEIIVSEAHNEAGRVKVQSQRELNEQIEEIKKSAIEKAKVDARNEVLENVNQMAQKLQARLDELEQNQKNFFISLENNLPQFALEIAGKILFKKVTQTPEEMDMLIKNTIAGIKGATWIDVKVGQNLKGVAEEILAEMSQNLKDRGTTLDVQTVKENNWEVVAESDKGIIDSSINTQIQNFMEFIETYQKKQGE